MVVVVSWESLKPFQIHYLLILEETTNPISLSFEGLGSDRADRISVTSLRLSFLAFEIMQHCYFVA